MSVFRHSLPERRHTQTDPRKADVASMVPSWLIAAPLTSWSDSVAQSGRTRTGPSSSSRTELWRMRMRVPSVPSAIVATISGMADPGTATARSDQASDRGEFFSGTITSSALRGGSGSAPASELSANRVVPPAASARLEPSRDHTAEWPSMSPPSRCSRSMAQVPLASRDRCQRNPACRSTAVTKRYSSGASSFFRANSLMSSPTRNLSTWPPASRSRIRTWFLVPPMRRCFSSGSQAAARGTHFSFSANGSSRTLSVTLSASAKSHRKTFPLDSPATRAILCGENDTRSKLSEPEGSTLKRRLRVQLFFVALSLSHTHAVLDSVVPAASRRPSRLKLTL
mmetsp:Transcript_15427/g.36694  ORF Transcript_15427/g.36694 Transcript_15427/m.36694 type:complete len:340 (-) Transcript_15427:651-1670(-)